MKLTSPMVFILLASAIPAAIAQDRIIGISPAANVILDLYDGPSATQPVRTINVSEAGMPLVIQSRQPGFYQVAIGGKEYWVRGSKVRISRDTSANCGAIAATTSQQTAGTPGAGKDACK